jgi:hypothetical protein
MKVPEKLTNPDPITKATKKRFYSNKKTWHKEFNDKESSVVGAFFFEGSKSQFNRALKIIDTMVKALKAKYKFKFSNSGSFVIIEGMEVELRFREKNKRVRTKTTFGYEHILKPTGYLSLKVHHDLSTREWSGTKRTPLEEKVASLVQRLENFAKEEREEKEALEKYWKEQRIKEEKEIRIREKRNQELEKFKELLSRSNRWHKTKHLRKYLKAMEDEAVIKKKVTAEFNEFLTWAVGKIDWYDPIIEREDEDFKKVNRETLEIN